MTDTVSKRRDYISSSNIHTTQIKKWYVAHGITFLSLDKLLNQFMVEYYVCFARNGVRMKDYFLADTNCVESVLIDGLSLLNNLPNKVQ